MKAKTVKLRNVTKVKLPDVKHENRTIDLPAITSEPEIVFWIQEKKLNWQAYVDAIKTLSGQSDKIVANWLNVTVRMLQSYSKPDAQLKENTKEHILLLLSVIQHGVTVFGNSEAYARWLNGANFYFDAKPPARFLTTISGIRFMDDQLTGIEYGDNA